jgi:hypothetical protein
LLQGTHLSKAEFKNINNNKLKQPIKQDALEKRSSFQHPQGFWPRQQLKMKMRSLK